MNDHLIMVFTLKERLLIFNFSCWKTIDPIHKFKETLKEKRWKKVHRRRQHLVSHWFYMDLFYFWKIPSSWEYEWNGSNPKIMTRDGVTKTCSQVKHLNDSGKMVPDNQQVTEWFQLSSPSAWGCEGDGGKFVFFFFFRCAWWRWDGWGECMMERGGRDRWECSRRCTLGVVFPPKEDNIVWDEELQSHHEMKMNLTMCLHENAS